MPGCMGFRTVAQRDRRRWFSRFPKPTALRASSRSASRRRSALRPPTCSNGPSKPSGREVPAGPSRRDTTCPQAPHPTIDSPARGAKADTHSGSELADPDSPHHHITTQNTETGREFPAKQIPTLPGRYLPGRYLRSRVCRYDNPPDLGFIIGPSAQSDRITVAAGTSGHAFTFAPALGEVIAQPATESAGTHRISLFGPRRLTDANA